MPVVGGFAVLESDLVYRPALTNAWFALACLACLGSRAAPTYDYLVRWAALRFQRGGAGAR